MMWMKQECVAGSLSELLYFCIIKYYFLPIQGIRIYSLYKRVLLLEPYNSDTDFERPSLISMVNGYGCSC